MLNYLSWVPIMHIVIFLAKELKIIEIHIFFLSLSQLEDFCKLARHVPCYMSGLGRLHLETQVKRNLATCFTFSQKWQKPNREILCVQGHSKPLLLPCHWLLICQSKSNDYNQNRGGGKACTACHETVAYGGFIMLVQEIDGCDQLIHFCLN